MITTNFLFSFIEFKLGHHQVVFTKYYIKIKFLCRSNWKQSNSFFSDVIFLNLLGSGFDGLILATPLIFVLLDLAVVCPGCSPEQPHCILILYPRLAQREANTTILVHLLDLLLLHLLLLLQQLLLLLFVLKRENLCSKTAEAEDGERTKKENQDTDDWTEDSWLGEEDGLIEPVGEVGGGGERHHPEHQPHQGGRVQDQPGRGHRHHCSEVGLTILHWTLCQDRDIRQGIECGKSNPFVNVDTRVIGFVSHNETGEDPQDQVDGRVPLEQGADDGDAAHLEEEARQESGRELDPKTKNFQDSLSFGHRVVERVGVSQNLPGSRSAVVALAQEQFNGGFADREDGKEN